MFQEKERVYRALNVGLFIFVEDEFELTNRKEHILMDLLRLNNKDRELVLSEIPDSDGEKHYLIDFLTVGDTYRDTIDWSCQPFDNIEFAAQEIPELKEKYDSVPQTLVVGRYDTLFLRYGIGVRTPQVFSDLFKNVIHLNSEYYPVRIYTNYIMETCQQIEKDIASIEDCTESVVTILDNIVGDNRAAKQMIIDLKSIRAKNPNTPIYATIFSTASKENDYECCTDIDFYVGYAKKSAGIEGVYDNILCAGINKLIQSYKEQLKHTVSEQCDILAQSPDLVKYLYSMSKSEGAPGYETLQEWISFMAHSKLETCEPLYKLMQLSVCLDSGLTLRRPDLSVPLELASAAMAENFNTSVNKFYTVTAPGDIFTIGQTLYVLVGQDCDYMMGEKRSRNTPLCELVPAEVIERNCVDKLDNDQKYVYINNYQNADGHSAILRIDYTKRIFLNNEIINLCTFNIDGHCCIDLVNEPSTEACQLEPPFILQYYKSLQKFYSTIKSIKEKVPEYLEAVEELRTAKPKVSVFDYEETDSKISFNIRRVARIRQIASQYLYKMYLEYRGRVPYTSINLTGYESVPVQIKFNDKSEKLTMYYKLCGNRSKNLSKPDKLVWYISNAAFTEKVGSLLGSSFHLSSVGEYIELKSKQCVLETDEAKTITVTKGTSDDDFVLSLNFK